MSNYNELRLTYQGGSQTAITLNDSTIQSGEYQEQNIIAVEVPEIVETIGDYAFCDNNDLESITLNEGLIRIEGQAFQHGVYTAVTIPSTVTYIGFNSFNMAEEQESDHHTFTVTCLATTPPTLVDDEGITFGSPQYLQGIYVPTVSVEDYKQEWPEYASKIHGGTAPVGPSFTNLDILSAYVGNVEVKKMYLGEDVIWEAPTDPCEGLSGQSLCECQGGYWWDDSCHDDPEPLNLKVKLTFDFPNTGEVKLYNDGAAIKKIEIDGEEIPYYLQDYFYDPSVSAGTHEVLYTYDENEAYIITNYAFYNLPNLVAIEVFGVPGQQVYIQDYAFAADSNTPSNVTAITLHDGISYLGPRAFEEIRNVTAITIPSSVIAIGTNCFYNFGVDNPVYYTFLGTTPPLLSMEENADLGNRSNIYINVPCEALNDYQQAWNYYSSRLYCGDLMKHVPLTFEITSVGTGETGSIGLRLSGDTTYTNKRQVAYFLNHEGTETTGFLNLREAVSNSAITSLISGLTVGDKIEFWGYTDQSGMSVSSSAFEYFVTSAGLTAKVYGNVNSLLFSGAFYHGNQVPQNAVTAPYAFYRLFTGKAGFNFGDPEEIQHIVLPVPENGLTDSIYREMFYGCTGLVKAPALPSLYMPDNCYRSMFNGCTGLTEAPELPATGVGQYACLSMFADCTSLTEAPELPITTMAASCYSNMFRGCTSLTDMPELPATTLASSCYTGMFSACTSLTGVTDLPATVMQEGCYAYMFARCTSLTEAPEFGGDAEQITYLRACYMYMFQACTGLTASPVIKTNSGSQGSSQQAFNFMFSGCTSLSQITCLITGTSTTGTAASNFFSAWTRGVPATGTFYRYPEQEWATGANGVPTGWTLVDHPDLVQADNG